MIAIAHVVVVLILLCVFALLIKRTMKVDWWSVLAWFVVVLVILLSAFVVWSFYTVIVFHF